MNKLIPVLKKCALFENMNEDELSSVLECLAPTTSTYQKDEIILLAGEQISSVGIVVSGLAQIVREDINGAVNLITDISEGDLFGEAFACAQIGHVPVTILTPIGCTVLFVKFDKIIKNCPSSCNFHSQLIKNMLFILASKNIFLNEKNEILSCRTTKEKLIAYLSFQAQKSQKAEFTIPFNRDELANYLSVNRSALSRTLSEMKEEGSIDFDKNRFKILE
ncbi:MAG: cyclic nucleotide-binding protein [Oscillospiraceae bacterium]|nr:cyclic nucleotide-binding protein [Oscillospiraceae bacterium]